jgi:muramoyltetrapeptide carboxypeptidase
MRFPKPLEPGAHIRVVSPASPVRPDQIQRGVETLQQAGYAVSFGRYVFEADGYLAGPDEQRAADLAEAFEDPGVHAVFCSRGGYGCARLLELLDLDRMAAAERTFCGFSDVTTLHLALNRRGLGTFHTPMLLTMSVERPRWVADSLLACLSGRDPLVACEARGETVVGGQAKGQLTGGCLCLLCDSIGTPEAFDARDKIVVIEDVDEPPHRVDAMLTHLLNAGALDGAQGIVVGEMTRTDDSPDQAIGAWPWRRIVEDRLAPMNVPMVMGFPFGHVHAPVSLPLGAVVELDADEGSLTLLEAPCVAG